jgi:SNF family Na+-dependent transporter
MNKTNEGWGTRVGMIFAMAGFAVGFGNFLRFPVQAIQNGGATFIIPYLVSFVFIGIPMLLSEWALGRYGGSKGYHSTPFMMQMLNKRKAWKYVGVFGIFTNIIVASYYTYLESWAAYFAFHSLFGSFHLLSQNDILTFFNNYVDSWHGELFPFDNLLIYVLVLGLNVFFLSRGLKKGVELVAKWGVPLLILMGIFLAIKAVTLQKGEYGAIHSGVEGLNFLWTPDFTNIWNPKVWLAAAGQIFFTVGIGWGSIQTYSSYIREKDDIVLGSLTAGWTNEFVEIVIGGSILIPLALSFIGFDKINEILNLGGLSLGFKVMPYLFGHFGPLLSAFSGFFWFGLLFIAGITSSIAMGSPFVSFTSNNFNWSTKKAALVFGLITLSLGLPSVLFFNEGVLDEFDFWGGTFSLFLFAMLEIILLSWLMPKNWLWNQIISGADIRLPRFFRFIIRYITPSLLIVIFISALIKPLDNEWGLAFKTLKQEYYWPLDNSSVIKYSYNAELVEQIEKAETIEKSALVHRLYLLYFSKLIILATYMALSIMVLKASRKIKFKYDE